MRKNGGIALAIAITALGIAAGVLRYFELTKGLEQGMVGGSALIPATRGVTIGGCLLAALGSLALNARKGSYSALYGSGLPKTIMVLAGFLFLAAAALGIAVNGVTNMMRMILSAFSAFCGGTMILSVGSEKQGEQELTEKEQSDKNSSFVFTVFPVFFFGFLLVALYVFHANDAVLEHYAYNIVAGVAAVAATGCVSSIAFGEGKPRLALAVSCIALFLAVMVTVGNIASGGDMQVAAIFGAAAVWSFGSVCAMSMGDDVSEAEAPETAEDAPAEEK